MNTIKIKKGDTVLVTVGKKGKDGHKGKQGKVIAVFPEKNRVIVDGLNMQKHHTKARSAKDQGGILEQAGPIDASNVMVICPKCGKATRVGYTTNDKGKKIRVCKKVIGGTPCGGTLDKAAKADKKPAAKKSEDKKGDDKKSAEKKVKPAAESAEAKPAKSPAAKKADVAKDAEKQPAKKSTAKQAAVKKTEKPDGKSADKTDA